MGHLSIIKVPCSNEKFLIGKFAFAHGREKVLSDSFVVLRVGNL